MTNPTNPTTKEPSGYPPILPAENPTVHLPPSSKDNNDNGSGGDNNDNFQNYADLASNLISVQGRMNYVTQDTQKIDIHRHADGCDSGLIGVTWQPTDVTIANGRPLQKTLHKDGYQLADFAPDAAPIDDFLDTNQVIDQYYPQCEQLLKEVLLGRINDNGSNNNVENDDIEVIKAFDHNIRISREEEDSPVELKGGGGSKAQVPIGMVHGDYTQTSGPKRLQDLAQPPKANDVLRDRILSSSSPSSSSPNKKQKREQAVSNSLLDPQIVQQALEGKRRFALINIWRNIDADNEVQELPLACADSKGVTRDNLRILSIHYPDRVGQNYFAVHSDKHQWYYFPAMKHSEAMLIKQWDSMGVIDESTDNDKIADNDENRTSCFAIHSAFRDPSSPLDAKPRKSIEVRLAVIWKEQNKQ